MADFETIINPASESFGVLVQVKKSQACKPGSVFHSIIYLGLLSPAASCSLPLTTSGLPAETKTRAGSPVFLRTRNIFGLTIHEAYG